jgi:RNA polymerase sigma-70 factor (ECF subfamily)
MEPSNEQLYCRTRKGDQGAMETLYKRCEPPLYRYAFQLSGSRAVAEEVTHEAFLQIIRPESRFDPDRGSLEAYLYGTVRNLIRAVRRSRAVEGIEEPAAEDDILRALIDDEMSLALHSALQELPGPYRDAVFLCDLEERSYEEAASTLGCPVGTIRSRLHRARQLLAARLKPLRLSAVPTAR